MATEKKADPQAGKKQVLLAYKGHTVLVGNKLGFEYAEIVEQAVTGLQHLTGKKFCTDKRLVGGESVGSIITASVTEDFGSVYTQGRALTGKRLLDAETATRWAAASEATKLAFEDAKAKKKAASVDPLRQALAPIKRAYAEASSAGKVQLLSRIIYLITQA